MMLSLRALPSRRHLRAVCTGVVLLAPLVGAACLWSGAATLDVLELQSDANTVESGALAPPSPPLTLTGDAPPPEADTRLPIAVMIDNLPGRSRPQYGLDRADVVYEMLVEGGITRFMAVYLSQDAERIEPVRSLRTPFLYMARELGALVGHVGASETAGAADASALVRDWQIPHVDGDSIATPYRRDPTRPAPHNMITSTGALRAEGESWGAVGPSLAASWPTEADDDDTYADAPSAVALAYGFAWGGRPLADFSAAWSYDRATNRYWRSMAGRPHVDAGTGVQLSFANVITQFASASVVDREGHVVYDLVGEGQAVIFRNGRRIEATWSKRDPADRTRYWDAEGREIGLTRGTTWIAMLPIGSPLTMP